jgi:hypothetical protein
VALYLTTRQPTALPFAWVRRRSPGMTHRPDIGLPVNYDALTAFRAEVVRLMSLTEEAFADVEPHALTPIPATIRATSSGVSCS